MNDALIARIEACKGNFSKGQRRIARYILDHYDKVGYMTACRLGNTVGVSESTVVRFAMELGYEGYPELLHAMQAMNRRKLTSVQRMQVTRERIGSKDLLDALLQQDCNTIRRTIENTDHEAFYAASDAILDAHKIYVLGARSCQPLASFLSYYLDMLFESVTLVQATSEAEILQQLIHIGVGDVLVGISFPRYSRKATRAAQFAQENGAKVVALTDSMVSPLAENADFALLANSDIAAIVDTLVAPLSLINALVVNICLRKEMTMDGTFQELEKIWDEHDVYEKIKEPGALPDKKVKRNAKT